MYSTYSMYSISSMCSIYIVYICTIHTNMYCIRICIVFTGPVHGPGTGAVTPTRARGPYMGTYCNEHYIDLKLYYLLKTQIRM